MDPLVQVLFGASLALLQAVGLFFIRELWELWKESKRDRDKLRDDLSAHVLEDARTYYTKEDYNEHLRPFINDVRNFMSAGKNDHPRR